VIEVRALGSLEPTELDGLLDRPSPLDLSVQTAVAKVLSEVKARGDEALVAFTQQFDSVCLQPEALRVPNAQLHHAFDAVDPKLRAALAQAKEHLDRFHERQRLDDYELTVSPGVQLGQRVVAFERVGLYVPKNLVSSLLMAAVPARLAGVRQLVVCTPPQADGSVPPAIQAAASLLDVDELYAVGGAQAIAALAYGTQTIAKVDKIVGPGNAYVTAAKAFVRDLVGIDLLAGPSEVLLVVDRVAGVSEATLSAWALAELRAQLEHGPGTSALLLARQPALAQAVADALEPGELVERNVALLSYERAEEAVDFVNQYAPEHLCLWGERVEAQLPHVHNAGSVFLGPWAPVALGDYTSGTNHVLPTARQARFSSALGVRDFVKTISYQRINPQGLQHLAPTVEALAQVEGMARHAESVRTRLEL